MIEYNRPLNGAEIAREMNITRQAVSYAIRKSMDKMYRHILNEGIAETPFAAILSLMIVLGVQNSDITDIQLFLKMFNKDVIKEVTAEAELMYNIRK